MSIQRPYLSVVVSSRNDNHGGDLNHRMQIFITAFLRQCQRFKLDAELIIVEWNPPLDRPSLAEQFDWTGAAETPVRIITVSPELHRTFDYSQGLPLFQMIAKNVRIRRARGEFVLATNIDLLFSDELMAFLAAKSLQRGHYYRTDRHDVSADVPANVPVEQQLEFCKHNLIRLNTRDFIYSIPHDAFMFIYMPSLRRVLSKALTSVFGSGNRLSSTHQDDLPSKAASYFLRHALRNRLTMPYIVRRFRRHGRYYALLLSQPERLRDSAVRTRLLHHLIRQPISIVLGLSRAVLSPLRFVYRRLVRRSREWEYLRNRRLIYQLHLHTNACGDFTAMAREDWFAVNGYAEFAMYSLHIDSLMLYQAKAAGFAEVALEPPLVTYHIEHGGGWSPEAEKTKSLSKSLKARGVPEMSIQQLYAYAYEMSENPARVRLNGEDWGLAAETLPDVRVLPSAASVSETGGQTTE